jgi:bifunctional non-homologous end joining protein LigD
MSSFEASANAVVDVDGRAVRLTSLDRVLFPDGFTKARMLGYYARIAEVMLPHLAARPVTLRRFPEGVEGPTWFQTRCRGHPGWVRTCRLTVPGGEPQDYCVVDDEAGLLWAANLSTVEFHPLLMRADDPETPTSVVFDLDPGAPAGLVETAAVAVWLRDVLWGIGLASFVKTSGVKGLHVVAPLNTPTSFEQTKRFARAVAATIAAEKRERVVDAQSRDARQGRVLVDWLQNDWRRSTVAPYSLRAGRSPTVSMPVPWEDVERTATTGDAEHLWFDPVAAIERLEEAGDVFRPSVTLRQRLPVAGAGAS